MSITNFGVPFRGKRVVHPGAYDYMDASESTIKSSNNYNVPIIIGESDAGRPGELVWLSDSEQARRYLKGGELLAAVEMMFSPIPEGAGGASFVGVVVTNENTKSSIEIGGMEIHSKEYGKSGNNIQVKIEDGAITGTRKLSVYRWDTEESETYDNLGAVLRVQYTGDKKYSAMSIKKVNESAKLTVLLGETAEDAVVDFEIELGDERYNTINKLANFFSTTSGYQASLVNDRNKNIPSASIEEIDIVDLSEIKYLKSLEEDINNTINDYSDLIYISKITKVTTHPQFTYLQGGSTGTSPLSWSGYLEICKTTFSDMIILLTSDESIHAQGLAYIEDMEKRGHRQLLVTGGGLGEKPRHAIERAKMLNHSRAVIVYPGIYHRTVNGGKKELPAYMTAALVAGRICGVDPAEPITFDYLSAGGLAEDLVVGDPRIDDLLRGGVCTLESVQNGGIRIVQGITTYTNLNNPVYREISGRRGADYIASKVRAQLEETFVGKKGLTTTETSVVTEVIDVLDKALDDELIAAYNPDSINVRFMNSVVYVDYMVAPVTPINFILITSRFVPDTLL